MKILSIHKRSFFTSTFSWLNIACLFAFVAMMSSCVFDNREDDCFSNLESYERVTRKVAFLIDMSNDGITSRATLDREDGNHNEHNAIGGSGNYAVFLNSRNQVLAISDLSLSIHEHLEEDENYEAYYIAQLEVAEEDLPLSCFIVLNAAPLSQKLKSTVGKNIDDVMNIVWETENNPEEIGFTYSGEGKYFAMANSIFINKDGTKRTTVSITKDHIQKGTADPAKFVIVEVERMVARFNLTVGEGIRNQSEITDDGKYIVTPEDHEITYCTGFAEDSSPIYETRNWKAKLVGWGMNALEHSSYFFRNIKTNENYFTGWNTPEDYRCYWAEDLHYTDTDYPWQYRRAVDYPLPYLGYETQYRNGTNRLTNFSYDVLSQAQNPFSTDRVIYTPENTYDSDAIAGKLDSRDHLLAGTHLIVCAELLTDLKEENDYKPYDVYRDRLNIYYDDPKACFWSLVRTFNYALQSQTQMRFSFYNWDAEKGESVETERTIFTHQQNLVLCYNDMPLTSWADVQKLPNDLFIAATVKDGDGKVIPWINGLNIRDNYGKGKVVPFYDKIDVNADVSTGKIVYTKYTNGKIDETGYSSNDNYMKSIIFEWIGDVDHFSNGKMYYSSNTYNGMTNMYGVVRNHTYTYNLKELKNVGTSVDNSSDPIVPNTMNTNDQLNIEVEILDWHRDDTYVPFL